MANMGAPFFKSGAVAYTTCKIPGAVGAAGAVGAVGAAGAAVAAGGFCRWGAIPATDF